MKLQKIEIDDQTYFYKAQKINGVTWIHYNGETYALEPEKSKSKNQKQAVIDPSKILSPMPGKILKINLVDSGVYESGHTLIVMEAMKMEYALKISEKSEIEKLNFQVGDQVTQGAVLARLNLIKDSE